MRLYLSPFPWACLQTTQRESQPSNEDEAKYWTTRILCFNSKGCDWRWCKPTITDTVLCLTLQVKQEVTLTNCIIMWHLFVLIMMRGRIVCLCCLHFLSNSHGRGRRRGILIHELIQLTSPSPFVFSAYLVRYIKQKKKQRIIFWFPFSVMVFFFLFFWFSVFCMESYFSVFSYWLFMCQGWIHFLQM